MENIVIDMEKMTCLGKVKTMEHAVDLSHICLPSTVKSTIHPFDCAQCFNGYTALELRLLIKNTCGQNFPDYHLNQLQVIAVELFSKMDMLDYEYSSLLSQANWKDFSCKEPNLRYDYVKGAKVPKIAEDGCLFAKAQPVPEAERLAKDWFAIRKELQAKSDTYIANMPRPAPVIAVAPKLPQQRAQSGDSTPKSGSVRDTIWQVADKLWEALGKTDDIKQILAMRKQAMSELESEFGVKKTSSSNELGKWQKARLPN